MDVYVDGTMETRGTRMGFSYKLIREMLGMEKPIVTIPFTRMQVLLFCEVLGVPLNKIVILGILSEGDKTINEILLRLYQLEKGNGELISFPEEWGAVKYHTVYKYLQKWMLQEVSFSKRKVPYVESYVRDGEKGKTAERIYHLNVEF